MLISETIMVLTLLMIYMTVCIKRIIHPPRLCEEKRIIIAQLNRICY